MNMPEALRLADCLDEPLYATHKQMTEAAAELRRLHDESEMRAAAYSSACGELRKAEAQCDALLEALLGVEKRCSHSGYVGKDGQFLKVIQAAIAKVTGETA